MDVHGHGRIPGVRIQGVKQKDTMMGTPVSASSRRVTCQENLFFFFFFFLPTKSYPKLPPVKDNIFIADEGKGQILGT